MDCNNYSCVNHSGKTNIITESENGCCFPTVSLTVECNYFGDRYYFVSDLMGDYAEEYPMNAYGYQNAVKAFNSLVAEPDRIYPLF